MGERSVKLRGEKKIGIDRRCFARPQATEFWTYVPVKRGVDFDDVKQSCQKFDGMYLLARHFRRIQNPVPVFVGPAGSPDADSRSMFHTGGPDARRLAQRLVTCG